MTLIILLILLLSVGIAEAAGPVNPKNSIWDAPLSNTDSSALIDLAGYNVYIANGGTVPSACPPNASWTKMAGPPQSTVTVIAASPTPTPGTKAGWSIVNIPNPPGQKWMTVTAVDLTGTEGSCATAVPFVQKSPNAPANVILGQ